MMRYNDLEIIILNPSSDGNRLSSDHYMATQVGKTLLAKIEDKDGLFIEHIQEIDRTLQNPEAGIYYFNIDSVDEATRKLTLTMEKLRWVNGTITNAEGSYITINPLISASQVGIRELASSQFYYMGNKVYINVFSNTLTPYNLSSLQNLTPLTDYWVESYEEIPITSNTVSGQQMLPIPDMNYVYFDVVDQDDYVLRLNIDYTISDTYIRLSEWTPANQQLRMVGKFKRDPNIVSYVNKENVIDFKLELGQTIEENQFKAITSFNIYSFSDLTLALDGKYYLTNLLVPGSDMKWECRVNLGQSQLEAYKNSMNLNLVPGVNIIIGDKTVVGDQVAMIVYPYINETYEIYGSKENIHFDISVRTNDMRTSSEIAGLIKEFLLVSGRERLETCGLTIFEISRSTNAESKNDGTGIMSTQTVTLSVSAAADWEVKKPLITRLDTFDMTNVAFDYAYPSKKVSINPIGTTYGSSRFLTSYY